MKHRSLFKALFLASTLIASGCVTDTAGIMADFDAAVPAPESDAALPDAEVPDADESRPDRPTPGNGQDDAEVPDAASQADAAPDAASNEPDGSIADPDGDGRVGQADCDETNPAVHDDADEICDGLDNDCDGEKDEGFPKRTLHPDADGDGFGSDNPEDNLETCQEDVEGFVADGTDCNDGREDIAPGLIIPGDGLINDCNEHAANGEPGEPGAPGQNGRDGRPGNDGADGLTPIYITVPAGNACPGGDGTILVVGIDRDEDGVPDPETAVVIPICNGRDGSDGANGANGNSFLVTVEPATEQQCENGGLVVVYGLDLDGDNVPDEETSTRVVGCNRPAVPQPEPTPEDTDGDGFNDVDDCAPNNAQVHPGAEETCDGLDNDCEGGVDEGVKNSYYPDHDGDGYGDMESEVVMACNAPPGHVQSHNDCNDNEDDVHPGLADLCEDGIDQDCNGADAVCIDSDSDDDGSPDAEDCDDEDPTVRPGIAEACNGRDDNCDSRIDEGVQNPYWPDADGDGRGDEDVSVNDATMACSVPAGFSADHTDCDDNNRQVRPGLDEVCGNGIDDNCDGIVDCAQAHRVFRATVRYPGINEPMQLNVEFSRRTGDLGQWDFASPVNDDPEQNMSSVSLSLNSDQVNLDGICAVRLNVTVGNPGFMWLCEGANETSRLSENMSVSIEIDGIAEPFDRADLTRWTPNGVAEGCSALLITRRDGPCAP